jgi:hypothetical protein
LHSPDDRAAGVAEQEHDAEHEGEIDEIPQRGTAADMTKGGTSVSYIRSTFVPESGQCMCLFSANDVGSVKALNEKAKLPFDRIVPALDLMP